MAVTTAPSGAGRLQVTVSTAPGVELRAVRFGTATNAIVEAGSQSGSGGFTVTLPAGSQQTTFVLRRVTSGQATTANVTVVDACGDWPTVVGGGATAF